MIQQLRKDRDWRKALASIFRWLIEDVVDAPFSVFFWQGMKGEEPDLLGKFHRDLPPSTHFQAMGRFVVDLSMFSPSYQVPIVFPCSVPTKLFSGQELCFQKFSWHGVYFGTLIVSKTLPKAGGRAFRDEEKDLIALGEQVAAPVLFRLFKKAVRDQFERHHRADWWKKGQPPPWAQ